MAQAIRTLTVEKGIEPRDFAIVAFGGAGAMHAAFLAEELDIDTMLVPRFPGAFSAWGMLETKLRRDAARGFPFALDGADLLGLGKIFRELSTTVSDQVLSEGVGDDDVEVRCAIDARYIGQEYTLTIPVGDIATINSETWPTQIKAAFDAQHHGRFGHSNADAPIEFVIARATALGDLGRAEPSAIDAQDGDIESVISDVSFSGKSYQAPVIQRENLSAGAAIPGPAIIAEPTATTVIPPGWDLTVDQYGIITATRS